MKRKDDTMNHEQLNAISGRTTDQKYIKFISDEGWKYHTEEQLTAGYARRVKAEQGTPLSLEEFMAERGATGDNVLVKQLYHKLLPLVEKQALTALELYQFAKFGWCRNHPEAVTAYQTGPKSWAVNTCDEEIPEDRALLLINSEYGFEASRIKLLGTPYYDATDWNFICFHCGACDWIMRNGELCQIYQ